MAKLENIYEETLLAAGSTVTVDLTKIYDKFVFTGSGALVGNITLTTSGSALKGHLLRIQWNCTFTAGGAAVSILGTTISTSLFGKSWNAECYYNGTSWDISLVPDFMESQVVLNANLIDASITGAKLVNATVTPEELSTEANTQVLIIECSFESGEQANNSVVIPIKGTLNRINYEVIKALAATDAGTITPQINGVAVTLSAPISIAASTPINTQGNVNCTALNTFVADDVLRFVAAKTTAGGKVRITVKYIQSI